MKSYFAINHNPDAKDLKQLSQKTGLPKRVLQVIELSFGTDFRMISDAKFVPKNKLSGVVSKCPSEMATNDDETRGQRRWQ